MENLKFIDDRHILVFLMELLAILGLTKLLSWPMKKFGLPTLPAELLVGIALGPTLFGRVFPDLFKILFPPDPLQHFMLDAVGWLGILFLLLAMGLEISLRSAWIQRGLVVQASAISLLVPLAVASLGVAFLGPVLSVGDDPVMRVLAAIFMGAFIATTAMPISVRILTELRVLRSDFGIFSAAVLSLNDLIGWLIFTTLLTSLGLGFFDPLFFAKEAGLTVLITVTALGLGVWVGNTIKRSENHSVPEVNEGLTLVIFTGLILGSFTTFIGIHALFGFFLAGMALSAARIVGENTRFSLSRLMESIFAPVFFAGVGLRVDILDHFDPLLFSALTLTSLVLRYSGGWLAGRKVKLPPYQRKLLGAINTAGGELHIIIAVAAMDAGIFGMELFSALVASTLLTSLVSTPLSVWAIKQAKKFHTLDWMAAEAVITDLPFQSKSEVFLRLARSAAEVLNWNEIKIYQAVLEREELMSTSMGNGIAFPHARVEGLRNPLVVAALCREGVQGWDTSDGKPVKLVFLILTDPDKPETQIAILKDLGRALSPEAARRKLTGAKSNAEYYAVLQGLLHDLDKK